jgi:hypothetical protein
MTALFGAQLLHLDIVAILARRHATTRSTKARRIANATKSCLVGIDSRNLVGRAPIAMRAH